VIVVGGLWGCMTYLKEDGVLSESCLELGTIWIRNIHEFFAQGRHGGVSQILPKHTEGRCSFKFLETKSNE